MLGNLLSFYFGKSLSIRSFYILKWSSFYMPLFNGDDPTVYKLYIPGIIAYYPGTSRDL